MPSSIKSDDIKMPLALPNPLVAVVTPIFNRVGNLKRFLTAFAQVNYSNYKMVVVDDGSTDGSAEYIKANYPDIVLLHGDGSQWWAGATNIGMKWALANNYDYVLTYNDDQVCSPDFLSTLLQNTLTYPSAILSPQICYLHDPKLLVSGGIRIDPHTRRTFGVLNETYADSSLPPYQVDCVPGYAMLIPIAVIKRIGLFDNARFPQIYMELDFCLRAQKRGICTMVIPQSVVWNDRSDKIKDPVAGQNPFKKLVWYVSCPKSYLHFGQNMNLSLLLYSCGTRLVRFYNFILFWMTYLVKLLGLSIFSKSCARRIKTVLALNVDKWA